MAAPKAPVLGSSAKEVSLDEVVFAAEVKPHLVHEAVRAELNAHRQGTRAAKSRGGLGNDRGDVLVTVAFDDGFTPARQQRISEREFRPIPAGGARGKLGVLHRVP